MEEGAEIVCLKGEQSGDVTDCGDGETIEESWDDNSDRREKSLSQIVVACFVRNEGRHLGVPRFHDLDC